MKRQITDHLLQLTAVFSELGKCHRIQLYLLSKKCEKKSEFPPGIFYLNEILQASF